MQHFLKPPPRAAGTWVISPELFCQIFVAMNRPLASLHMSF